MVTSMPETEDISKLANILHQNGDKVLNGLSKLSLNAILLQRINNKFEQYLENDNSKETNKFHVLASSNSSQMIQDLHFLHDFMQKTIALKLTNNTNLPLLNNKVDLSKFKSIKYLEIKKIPVKEIAGLKVIQSNLESIVCIKGISKLEELLAECGADNSNGFVWSELREAVINHNNIKVLDTSIAFAPWLQVLDLSHNQIVNVKSIECLPNLKYINLSYNCLSAIPTFSKSARKKMQVLVLKHNYIEDLSGLADLDYLTELDLSWNWISNYECLQPLLKMSVLQNFSLQGNPIKYHKDFRRSVIGYLHINASFSDFVLDGSPLSKSEKSIVGYKLCESARSTNSSPTKPVINSSPMVQTPNESIKFSDKAKKSGKARLAVIPNLDGTFEDMPTEISSVHFAESASKPHLITANKTEDARRTFWKDNWLGSEAGSVIIQSLLSLPPNIGLSSTPCDDSLLEAALNSEDNIFTTTAIVENNPDTADVKSDKVNLDSFVTCPDKYPSNYLSVDNPNDIVETTEEKCKEENDESKETSPDIEPIPESSEEIEDENERLYLVSRITKGGNDKVGVEELFLTLTDSELKEKDSNQGRVVNKWCISSLESCTKLQANKLNLTFDTVKRDKRERTYEMEQEEAQALYKILSAILESRTLQDMNQIAYKCMSCSSQFSQFKNRRKQEANSRCPFCNSKLILEADDHSPFEQKSAEKNLSDIKTSDSKATHSRSSSAGVIQGLIGQLGDKVVKCPSQSSIGSAASLDELNDLPASQNTNVKRSDSDIEILSNPSQSSIEVIDGPSRMYGGNTPRRKRSSEERQVVQTSVALPENLTQNINVGGLTESSSSGSVTDSVCTAYENSSSNPTPHRPENVDVIIEEAGEVIVKNEERKKFDSVTEEATLKKSKTHKGNRNAMNTSDEVKYSYTDFTKVDHRIKLLLHSQIFEDNNEEFCFILRCSVLLSSSGKSSQSCIVSSNKKLYILKVIGPEQGDDASSFLQKTNYLKFNLKSLKSVSVLTWYQGFSVKIQESHEKLTEFLILLRDQKRTQYFLKFLQSPDTELPSTCKIIKEFSQKPILAMQHLLVSGASEDANIQYFSLLCSSSVICYPDVKEAEAGAILTNSTDLLLFASEPTWLCDGAEQLPQPFFSQKLSNLMSVEIENSRVCLQFLNELEEKEEIWDLTMETSEAIEELINSVKAPWQEIFSVPLQVSTA